MELALQTPTVSGEDSYMPNEGVASKQTEWETPATDANPSCNHLPPKVWK